MKLILTFAAAVLAVPAIAQNYELGIQGGASIYQSKQISSAGGSADAGFAQGWTAGFTLGNNMYKYVGGEFRYSYLNNGLKLSSGDTTVKFGGQSHAFHYDVLIHGTDATSHIRPYVAIGGGVKLFRGTGTEQAFQPLSNFAILTKTKETQGLFSAGLGVKIRMSENLWFRFDVHDYLTPFPKKVITPVSGQVKGWLHNFVPTAGLTLTF